jgi:peptide/nickel transport system substrate-binding protein
MKKLVIAAAISLVLVLSLGAQVKNGPIVDKVIFDVRMDRTIGWKDTVAGKTDLFTENLGGKDYKAIPAGDLDKLSSYFAPGTYDDLSINPVPNAAPYQVTTKDGKVYFNPFAIREVRFALNWIIDRKKIVDEICLGMADPMYNAMTPGQPGTYKYNLINTKLGMTARGNEQKAIADITAAMTAASQLPENKGKLVKNGQFWTFNGDPVTVNFLIRVDDPSGRLLIGRYVSDQIEKAGIKVNRLEWDRSKCIKTETATDPADYQWNLYTEGWVAGGMAEYYDVNIAQMYAPYYTNMPGWGESAFWNYKNDEIDAISQTNANGWFLTADDYWKGNVKATEIATKDAIRVYLVSLKSAQIANKDRFVNRMAYGLGVGVDTWSIRGANVKPDTTGPNKGLKVLHVTQFSSRGDLYMSALDPVGVDGFNGVYETMIFTNCSDMVTFPSSNSAKPVALRVKYDLKNVDTQIKANPKGGKPLGLIPVDKSAVIYDSSKKAWVSGVEYIAGPDGKNVYSANPAIVSYSKLANASYVGGTWHDGNKIDLSDTMYAIAFQYEWANKDGADDKLFDESLSAQWSSLLPVTKGVVLNKDGSFTTYFDYNFPMDKNYVAQQGSFIIDVKSANPGRQTVVEWPVVEALAKIVTEGSKSGEFYSFSSDGAQTEVDVTVPKCVSDIKAKLQDMIAAKYVPVSIQQWVTPDQAVARYKNAIAFIDKYGNAYISNGPFMVTKIDTTSKSIELTADRNYPIKSDWLPRILATTVTRIDGVKVPATVQRTKDASIDVAVSAVVYPNDTASAADGKVKLNATLVLADGSEKNYVGKFVKAGSFQVVIPAKDLGALKAGPYTLVVQTQLKDEAPAVTSSTIVLF